MLKTAKKDLTYNNIYVEDVSKNRPGGIKTLQVRRATIVAREFIRVVRRATVVALLRRSLFTSISRGLRKLLKAVLQELVAGISLAMPPIITLPPVLILLKKLVCLGKSYFFP